MSRIIPRTMILESANSIWHSGQPILKQPISFMRKWDVSASKIRRWEFTSLLILMDTGLRSYRRGKKTGGYPLFMNKRYQIYGRESTGISGLICVEKGIEDCHRYGGNIAEKRML